MHSIDWLHSPGLPSSMNRFIKKYERFFDIMSNKKSKIAVPTLCIDLVWHTHQLSPADYYGYSERVAGRFIDHNDRIEETELSEAFAWTSKIYQSRYGEPYSECTCWYCEAIRNSHSYWLDRVFRSANYQAQKMVRKHSYPSDPDRSVHVSTHTVVRDESAAAAARRRDLMKSLYRKEKQKGFWLRRSSSSSSLSKSLTANNDASMPIFIDHDGKTRPTISDLYTINTSDCAIGNCVAGSCGENIPFSAAGDSGTSGDGCDGAGGCGGSGCGGGCGG